MARLDGSKSLKNRAQATIGTPAKPSNLSDRAGLEWDRMTRELERSGIQVTPAHRAPLELAATIAADIYSDRAALDAGGIYSTNEKTGALQIHPAAKRLDALRRDYLKALSLLGLKPATVSEPSDGEEDELADMID